MTRSRICALAIVAAMGCSRGSPPVPEIREPPVPSTPAQPLPGPPPSVAALTSASAQPPASAPAEPPPRPFQLTELAPTQGDLVPLLKDQVERAKKKQLRTVVELYADWCKPCRAFQASLGDKRMMEALRGTFLVKVSFDDWQDKLAGTGFEPKAIPMFYLVGDDGRPTGQVLDGDKWGKNTVPNMAAALDRFLGR